MIKKLVKYGNSNALVLDKALLEILNIQDGTKLKLTTDGTSLTITPLRETEQAAVQPVSVSEGEATLHYHNNLMLEQASAAVGKYSPEEWQQFQLEFNDIMKAFDKKYNYQQKCMMLMNNADYKAAVLELDQRALTANMKPEEYMREKAKLMQTFMPEVPLTELSKASQALEAKYQK
jgi:antitoxin component of MazEF toxin-antitoxin module